MTDVQSETDAAAKELWPLTDEGVENIRGIIDQLTTVGEAIGDFTDKEQVRQTGVTLYLTFDKKVDVMTTGQQFVVQLLNSPAMLADTCRRLLAAHGMVGELRACERLLRAALSWASADSLGRELVEQRLQRIEELIGPDPLAGRG